MSGGARYVAFLRGMNVGGHRLSNDELRSHFEGMGMTDVASFRASGNVAFSPVGALADMDEDGLSAHIEQQLELALGYAVPTYIRSDAEVRAIAAHTPFPPEAVTSSAGKLQVSLLAGSPTRSVRANVLAHASDDDALAFRGRELYWLPSGGLLDSALDLDAIDRLLGACTRRTKGTIEQLAAKHCPT